MNYEPAGSNLLYRNPPSALDMFGSIALKNKPRRYGLLRRKKFDLNQANANLMMYTPFMKSDSVIAGDASRWESDMLQEIAKREKGEISETEKRISQTGAAIGVVSAPAAILSAYKGARAGRGNTPRDFSRYVGRKLPQGTAKKKILRAVEYLDKPKSTKAKAAALLASGGIVGIQAANTAGDIVTSRAMANAQRADRKD